MASGFFGRRWVRVVLIILAVIAVLALSLVIALCIAYGHRSDPSGVKHYQITNPFIAENGSLIVAHRAGAGIAPEATMMGFRLCIEDPDFDVDLVEFDLHITKDNILVLLHDEDLDRVSDCQEVFGKEGCRPEDYTFEELRQLNMGAKFVTDDGKKPYAGLKGDAVPDELKVLSLDMILDYLESMGCRAIIEVKNSGELGKRSVDILYRTLKERNMLDSVLFGTFDKEIARYKDEAYPDLIRCAYGMEVFVFYLNAIFGLRNYDPDFGVLALPFHEESDLHFNLGTATLVNYAHAHDIAVQYWTVNDAEEMEYLMSIGADGITTDYPDVAYDVREDK